MPDSQVRIEPMSEADFLGFRERAIPRRADRFAARGIWTRDRALEASRRVYDRALSEGLSTPHQHLGNILEVRSGLRVGEVWYSAEEQGGSLQFWVEWIWIEPEFRRRGYATAALTALEEEARRLGATRLGLDVWTDNPPAIELYRRLGYSPARVSMVKPLGPRDGAVGPA
jgi:ribosomal protein S18 acetylase RimI-like enzyme